MKGCGGTEGDGRGREGRDKGGKRGGRGEGEGDG